ncbi:MAG: hypothetical protein A2Y17_00380 [Clostridiales bacterium GWF2_38_85]|nr:MAG: hypothetical protein A2Y17_00380 [Clostridiales bacterium GWF2_38_85]HBL83550.1 hypothetical protein [Clostridiales bacterium]
MENNFTPGIRFYFLYDNLINHPKGCFDGYHSIKIKDELILSNFLYACVITKKYKCELEFLIPTDVSKKVVYLSTENLIMMDWADKHIII